MIRNGVLSLMTLLEFRFGRWFLSVLRFRVLRGMNCRFRRLVIQIRLRRLMIFLGMLLAMLHLRRLRDGLDWLLVLMIWLCDLGATSLLLLHCWRGIWGMLRVRLTILVNGRCSLRFMRVMVLRR